MVKAARAQGMPTMVMTMMTPATSQAMAIQRPPNLIRNLRMAKSPGHEARDDIK